MKRDMIRSSLVSLAFLVMVGAVVAGATSQGETNENSIGQSCERASWPSIPAACLAGGQARDVRLVGADIEAAELEAESEIREIRLKFVWAFGGP